LVLDEALEYVGVYFFILAGDRVFDYNKREGSTGHEMLFKMRERKTIMASDFSDDNLIHTFEDSDKFLPDAIGANDIVESDCLEDAASEIKETDTCSIEGCPGVSCSGCGGDAKKWHDESIEAWNEVERLREQLEKLLKK